jgi:hypothetical protein
MSPVHAQEGDDSLLPNTRLDRLPVPAPIESVELVASSSTPTGHALSIVSGLSSNCAETYDYGFFGVDHYIYAYVLKTVPIDRNVACTFEYRTYDATIDLGADFLPGETYAAVLNTTPITSQSQGGIVPRDDGGDRVIVDAPIESVDVVTLEYPPELVAGIVARLSSACGEQDDYTTTRVGTETSIHVTNSMPPDYPICTMIYRALELDVKPGERLRSESDLHGRGEWHDYDVHAVRTRLAN